MGFEIPFDIGQNVWVLLRNRIPATYKECIIGHDHLGPIGGQICVRPEEYYYTVERRTFSLLLLKYFDLSEIYDNELDANMEMFRKNA